VEECGRFLRHRIDGTLFCSLLLVLLAVFIAEALIVVRKLSFASGHHDGWGRGLGRSFCDVSPWITTFPSHFHRSTPIGEKGSSLIVVAAVLAGRFVLSSMSLTVDVVSTSIVNATSTFFRHYLQKKKVTKDV
jgi:hypothetical protein